MDEDRWKQEEGRRRERGEQVEKDSEGIGQDGKQDRVKQNAGDRGSGGS